MTEEQYHIIDQYINNELQGEALAAFEQQLLQDAELAETVEAFKMLNNEMPAILKNKSGGEALKKSLQQLSPPHFEHEGATVIEIKKNNRYKITAVAAMLIAMAGIVFWQLNRNDKPDLYAQYIGHTTISLTSRGNTNQDTLAKATAYYNSQQYIAVIPLLQPVLQQDSSNINYKMILGRCYIENNNYERAFALLNTVITGSSAYKYDAVWLTAMGWLKQHKNTECIAVLQTIPADDDHYIEAQELLAVLMKQ